jgi:hypothetical protein
LRRGSASSRGEAGEAGEGRDHHRRHVGGVAGDGVERAGDGRQPRADAQRRARRQPRRAGAVGRAGDDERRAARIFVGGGVEPRRRGAPDRRRVDEGLGRDRGERGLAEADVGEDETAAQRAPGQQQMPRLEAEKVTLALAWTAPPRTLPVAPSTPEGVSTLRTGRPERATALIASTQAERRAVDVARQAGAVQRVDDEVGAVEGESFAGANRPAPALRRQSRIAAHPRAIAEQRQFDRIAPGFEQPRGDEAVAAVAARPAQNGDPAAARRHPRRLPGDRQAGALHQRNARRSRGDGRPIDLGHLSRSQQFGTAARIKHGAIVAPSSQRGKARRRRWENWRFPSRDFLLYRAGVPA